MAETLDSALVELNQTKKLLQEKIEVNKLNLQLNEQARQLIERKVSPCPIMSSCFHAMKMLCIYLTIATIVMWTVIITYSMIKVVHSMSPASMGALFQNISKEVQHENL